MFGPALPTAEEALDVSGTTRSHTCMISKENIQELKRALDKAGKGNAVSSREPYRSHKSENLMPNLIAVESTKLLSVGYELFLRVGYTFDELAGGGPPARF